MNNKLRRQRSKNFSDEEEAELVKLVKANQLIIENKKSGALIWKQKEETWDKIALVYTRRTGIQRTAQALKAKYEGLKKKYKSELTEETSNTSTLQTGEKPQASTKVSNASEETYKSPTEFQNIFDSDNISNDVETRSNEFQLANSGCESSNDNVQVKVEPPEPLPEVNKWTSAHSQPVQTDKQSVLLAQQTFYEHENVRAQEKHLAEMELLKIKRDKESKAIELLDLQIAEKKRCIEVTNSYNG